MHHIYTTPAFVVHSTPYGEAGRFLLLFTRDFGMVGAVAQGVRLVTSKLRYHLQDSHFSNISIVRGKEVWRVTGAHGLDHEESTVVHRKVLKLLKRLLQGEEKNEKLFEILESLYASYIPPADYDMAESITVLRILSSLGYIHTTGEFEPFLRNNLLDQTLLSEFSLIKSQALKAINHALKESQL